MSVQLDEKTVRVINMSLKICSLSNDYIQQGKIVLLNILGYDSDKWNNQNAGSSILETFTS